MSLKELEPFIKKHLLASDRTKTSAKAIRRLLLQDQKATYNLNWIGQNKVVVDKHITELSNHLDSDASSDEGPQLSPPPRKVPSTGKNHCPPPTQTRHARPRTDSLSSSLSSTYTAASSQSQGPLHPHQKRSISPTASSVFSLSSEVSTATSFLNTSKLPLASFSPEQLADRLRLPPLSTREQTKADNLETIFTSDAFQQATSLENQTVPSNHYGGGGTSKLIEVDEEDNSYPTWETGSPPKDKTNEEEEDFGERLDELGEMMQIVRKGGSRKALKKLTALQEAGGGRTSSTSPPSKNHRNTSVESQSPEGTNKKRTYSSDLPLASSTTKKQKREKLAALPESESSGGGMGEVDELEVEAGTGFRKPYNLSEALQEVVGASRLSRPECVKRIWGYIKAHSLQKPTDKRYIMCDDKLFALFRVPEMTTMNVILSKHLSAD